MCIHHDSFFTDQKDNQGFSLETSLSVDNRALKSSLVAIGEDVQRSYGEEAGIYRINVFNFNEPLPTGITFSRDNLIKAIFEYGIARIYEKHLIPKMRPVVYIRGADRFKNHFVNPRNELAIAAKEGGAMVVIFDEIPKRA
jgi:hypothetical protein